MAIADQLDDHKLLQEVHQTVFEALTKLSPEERQRVLQSITTLLGLSSAPRPVQIGVPRKTVTDAMSIESDFSADRTISPKQFLLEKQPKTDVERVACLAYYLTHFENTPYFKTVEISKLNTEAAQQKFSNPSHSVNNAVKMGYLASAVKGQKQLSAPGEVFVQALPDRSAAKESMANARPRRKARKKSANTSTKKSR